MSTYQPNKFLFSSEYRVLRHVVFWVVYTVVVALIWQVPGRSFGRSLFNGLLWLPIRMLYCYPLIYWVLPQFLLKGKYIQFAFLIISWALAGSILNYVFRAFIFIPIQEYLQFEGINKKRWEVNS